MLLGHPGVPFTSGARDTEKRRHAQEMRRHAVAVQAEQGQSQRERRHERLHIPVIPLEQHASTTGDLWQLSAAQKQQGEQAAWCAQHLRPLLLAVPNVPLTQLSRLIARTPLICRAG